MSCKGYRIVFKTIERNDMHWDTWGNKILWKIWFSGKLIFRKYANSENCANSEITPEDFANSEPGAKFSVFLKPVILSLGSVVAIGGCFHNLLCNKHSL